MATPTENTANKSTGRIPCMARECNKWANETTKTTTATLKADFPALFTLPSSGFDGVA